MWAGNVDDANDDDVDGDNDDGDDVDDDNVNGDNADNDDAAAAANASNRAKVGNGVDGNDGVGRHVTMSRSSMVTISAMLMMMLAC